MLAARLMLVALLAAAVLGLGSIAPRGTERQHHHSSPIRVVSGTSSGAAPPPPKPPADEYENQVYYENVAPHPFNVTDLVRADRIGNPVVSPNGQFAVYTRRVWSVSLNQSSTTLWVSYISSGAMAPLTPFGYGGARRNSPSSFPIFPSLTRYFARSLSFVRSLCLVSESDPCWLPDSNTVLFLSNRQLGTTQIWQVQVPATPSQMAASPVRISYAASSLSTHSALYLTHSLLLQFIPCRPPRPEGEPLGHPAGIRRRRVSGLEHAADGRARRRQRRQPDARLHVHQALRAPLGHVLRRPPQPSVPGAAHQGLERQLHRRQPARRAVQRRRRRSHQAVRRLRGVELLDGRRRVLVHAPLRRDDARRMDHQPRPALRLDRRRLLLEPRVLLVRQHRHRHAAALPAQRPADRLRRHRGSRLRGRSLSNQGTHRHPRAPTDRSTLTHTVCLRRSTTAR